MNKKGQVELVIGLIILAVVVVIGGLGTLTAISDNRYVVDITSNEIYDLTICSISQLNQSNLRYEKDVGALLETGTYRLAKC